MFEQTFVHTGGATRKPLSMAVSLTTQLLLTAVVVAVPLLKTAEIAWKPPVVVFAFPLPPRPRPVELPPTSGTQIVKVKPVFDLRLTAPAHIPSKVSMVVDEVAAPAFNTGAFPSGNREQVILSGDPIAKILPPAPVRAAPSAKPAQERLKVGGDVQKAMILHQRVPVYPAIALTARISGTVILAAIISKNGSVQKLQLISGPPLLADAAISAVREWTYKPTLLNGEPVEVITEITVSFTLSH
jgi:periplasmic protein TonB